MLKGIKVIEFEGLAPSVFLGMVLSDYGAEVTVISRVDTDTPPNPMNRGKQSMTFDLKNNADIDILKKLVAKSDVLIDPFRPGVLERVGLSYQICSQINPKIIYARVSSFGQISPYKHKAGHDLNFIALSGALSLCASTGSSDQPAIPANLLGDFAAGGAMGAASILAALLHVKNNGMGQEIDIGMAQTSFYLTQFILHQRAQGLWNNPLGHNVLDGGAHFYNVYKTKDGKYMTVACIEEKFYKEWVKGLRIAGVSEEKCQILLNEQYNQEMWKQLKVETQAIFSTKARIEWELIFKDLDACCMPVIDLDELTSRQELGTNLFHLRNGNLEAQMQPQFSKFKQSAILPISQIGQHNYLKPKL